MWKWLATPSSDAVQRLDSVPSNAHVSFATHTKGGSPLNSIVHTRHPGIGRRSSDDSFRQFSDRLFGFVHDEEPSTWKEAVHLSVLSERYKAELENAADYINDKLDSPACALVLNLGPAWLRPDAYALFNNNVIEVPFKDWESPPGLGVVPLDVMFTVCSSMASWLQLNDEHVVVLHTRSCSGMGMHVLRFLAAAYLTFNMDFGNVGSALASLPKLPVDRKLRSFVQGAGSVKQVAWRSKDAGHVNISPSALREGGTGGRSAALLPQSGPGQVRYGEYFCSVLYSPVLRGPHEISRQLRQVVFSPMSGLDLSACTDGSGVDGFWTGDVSPFLVVFQHGRRVWAGFAESQDGLVPFNIGVPVVGDIALGIWFGSYNLGARLHSRPAISYVFHTAFLEDSGLERVDATQLDVAHPDLFPVEAQRKFFMDIKLGPPEAPSSEETLDGELIEGGDVQWMREKWRELMGKMYGSDARLEGRSDAMDAVLMEMRARQQQSELFHADAGSLRSASATSLGGSSTWAGNDLDRHHRTVSTGSELSMSGVPSTPASEAVYLMGDITPQSHTFAEGFARGQSLASDSSSIDFVALDQHTPSLTPELLGPGHFVAKPFGTAAEVDVEVVSEASTPSRVHHLSSTRHAEAATPGSPRQALEDEIQGRTQLSLQSAALIRADSWEGRHRLETNEEVTQQTAGAPANSVMPLRGDSWDEGSSQGITEAEQSRVGTPAPGDVPSLAEKDSWELHPGPASPQVPPSRLGVETPVPHTLVYRVDSWDNYAGCLTPRRPQQSTTVWCP
eukprot:jgi/Botrbrau1/21870/Bobra.0249s0001.1